MRDKKEEFGEREKNERTNIRVKVFKGRIAHMTRVQKSYNDHINYVDL